jgi:hypothetical protein
MVGNKELVFVHKKVLFDKALICFLLYNYRIAFHLISNGVNDFYDEE